jgi:hypothetical protein
MPIKRDSGAGVAVDAHIATRSIGATVVDGLEDDEEHGEALRRTSPGTVQETPRPPSLDLRYQLARYAWRWRD